MVKKTANMLCLFSFMVICFFVPMNIKSAKTENGYSLESFGESSFSREMFDYIVNTLPRGSVVLEFGSGWASGMLSQHFIVYSIEHDEYWLNRFDTNYIYAPLKDDWYDPKFIKVGIPLNYDLIIVDGPPGYEKNLRRGFLDFLFLFDCNVMIIVDDVDRENERKILEELGRRLGKKFEVYSGAGKQFGVIFP